MNFGLIVRNALRKAQLPEDAGHLELAKTEANEIIESIWYRTKSRFRQSRDTIVTVAGSDEYVLNKLFDDFVKNSLQSSTGRYRYLEPEEFFRRILLPQGTSGQAYIYTYGDMSGVDLQLVSASRIVCLSSLASKTTGDINVTAGSNIVRSDGDIFDINDVGLRLQRDGDDKTYKIAKYIDANEIHLSEKYRGQSGNNVSYKIGDVGVHVNVQGFVGGQVDSEDVVLDGSNAVMTSKTFNTLISVSKSDRTGGKITARNEANNRNVAVLSPGETEIERQTIVLWPNPDSGETLNFRYYMKHPLLWLDTDRPLIPSKWHRLIRMKLEKRLLEFAGMAVPDGLTNDIAIADTELDEESEDITLTDTVPSGDEEGTIQTAWNYDHDEDFS